MINAAHGALPGRLERPILALPTALGTAIDCGLLFHHVTLCFHTILFLFPSVRGRLLRLKAVDVIIAVLTLGVTFNRLALALHGIHQSTNQPNYLER